MNKFAEGVSKKAIERILTDQALRNQDKFAQVVGLLRRKGYVVQRDPKNSIKFHVVDQCVVCNARVDSGCSVKDVRCLSFVPICDIVED